MRIVIFCHSLRSCWNHGNAHFLRGICTELMARGHEVRIYEPSDGWSVQNLVADHGAEALDFYREAYPHLQSIPIDYHEMLAEEIPVSAPSGPAASPPGFLTESSSAADSRPALHDLLKDADLVLVHEWNEPALVKAIGDHHKSHPGYRLLFHDTHHRAATEPEAMRQYDLSGYDGVLAFGEVIRDLYLRNGWARTAWSWHEAADPSVFRRRDFDGFDGDLVWIGNWGDEERTAELHEFLIEPVRELGLKAKVFGVRYPEHARKALEKAGIEYGGWLPNHRVPEVFARYRMTVHIPRRPYVEALPGIPTIRVFESLACQIPLISAPWEDSERLFAEGRDYLIARTGVEMCAQMRWVIQNPALAACIAHQGWKTLMSRHTCAHRVDELESILGIASRNHYRTGAVAI